MGIPSGEARGAPMPPNPTFDFNFGRGYPVSLPITVTDRISLDLNDIVAVNPVGPTFTITGSLATTFAAGKTFRVTDNRSARTNGLYTVASVSESGGNTVITVTALAGLPIITVDASANQFTVDGDYLAAFGDGVSFYVSGNTGAALANSWYTVKAAWLQSGDTVIAVIEDVPSGTTATGSVYRPVIAPDATASGTIRRAVDDPVDLSGYTVAAQIRAGTSQDATLLATFTVDTDDLADGIITLSLTGAQTTALAALIGTGKAYWDCRATSGDGLTVYQFPPGTGTIRFSPTVTA